MSFIDDQIDDYLNYGIAEDEDYSYDCDEEDGNEKLNRYYERSYGEKMYDKEMDLYR